MSKFDRIVQDYEASFALHGDSPAAVLCPKGRQGQRFDILLDEIARDDPDSAFSILDFGCGLGHLLEHLGGRFPDCRYHGVDIVADFIEANRLKFGGRAEFEHIAPNFEPMHTYDYVFVSGTFNLSYFNDKAENEAYVRNQIKMLFGKTRRIMTCDFMTSHVDFQQPDATHMDPGEMCTFAAEELTRRFKLRHDYMPYEFAMVLYRRAEILRPDNTYAGVAKQA
jgi:SAM-dependent methyltransferase